MRLGILTCGVGWHVDDLVRAARERGIQPRLLEFAGLVAAEPTPIANSCDALIVRIMPTGSLEQVIFRMDALAAAHNRGTRVINPPKALETCIDKYLTTHRLALAGLPVPRTWVGESAAEAMKAFADLGGDVVVKPLFGSEGRGMARVNDRELAWRVFGAIEWARDVIYQQEFIRHPGWDLRLFIVAGRVIAAMRRYAGDDWRTNIAQGGRAEAVRPTAKEQELAVAAAQTVGCVVAGVDLIPADGGYRVLEVNAVPGWQAIAAACAVDVAGEIVDSVLSDEAAMSTKGQL